MIVLVPQFIRQPAFSLPRSLPSQSKPRLRFSARPSSSLSSMAEQTGGEKLMEFPHLRDSVRDVMVDLVSTMETRLHSHLLPSSLPPEVQYFQNHDGNSQGALHLRSGDKNKSSPVDLMLANWLHSELPSGGSLNITTLTAYLNSSTDAPGFLVEMVQSSPTSLLLFLDLLPRKELVLYPEYIDTFYGETQLDTRRQRLYNLPQVRPYYSNSLYIRCIWSPTPIAVSINCEDDGVLDEIVRGHVGPVAKEVLGVWLDKCACGGREIGEEERVALQKRDRMTRKQGFEIDLVNSLPRMFAQDVSSRILEALRGYFIKPENCF